MRILLAVLLMICSMGTALAQQGSISASDWQAYRARFVDESGRVIDDANGHISHSEGQGYGLLLAYLAGNRADFDLIWSFTRTELLLRDDGLAVWKWDPNTDPHVSDSNNASDGDILIALALAQAGAGWDRKDLTATAQELIAAIWKFNVIEHQGQLILLPGVSGFAAADRADGPVINLSYWIFEAFQVFAKLDASKDWTKLTAGGLSLIDSSLQGQGNLPSDWMSVKTRLKPAKGFPLEFGYNSFRIPLYLMRADINDPARLRAFRKGMSPSEGKVAVVDLTNNRPSQILSDPGYAAIPALIDCVLDKKKLPENLSSFAPTLYYPSTLHLLSLSFASSHHPECL